MGDDSVRRARREVVHEVEVEGVVAKSLRSLGKVARKLGRVESGWTQTRAAIRAPMPVPVMI